MEGETARMGALFPKRHSMIQYHPAKAHIFGSCDEWSHCGGLATLFQVAMRDLYIGRHLEVNLSTNQSMFTKETHDTHTVRKTAFVEALSLHRADLEGVSLIS